MNGLKTICLFKNLPTRIRENTDFPRQFASAIAEENSEA